MEQLNVDKIAALAIAAQGNLKQAKLLGINRKPNF